ncbi:hypothetical protein H4Q26_009739 [Puccinia striiformis f. sp. tritici PST-130]|nr:hypothetical protein H4Q26_009739 [Puccinia striiformis f. sp. tritici PST-130]
MFKESHGEELLKNQPIAKRNTGTELPTIGGPLSQLKVLQTTRPGLTNGTLILPSTFGTIYEGEDSRGSIFEKALKSVIYHHILELGLHFLNCTVTHEEPPDLTDHQNINNLDLPPHLQQNHLRSYRILSQFQVLNPLSIETKIYED